MANAITVAAALQVIGQAAASGELAKFAKKLDETGNEGEKAAKKIDLSWKRVGAGLKSARLPIAAVGGAVVGLGVLMIKAASDMTESVNAVNVVFKDAAKTILDFGKTASTTVGLSNAAFNQMATMTGSLLAKTGLDMESVAKQTINLSVRAADLASVFNTDVKLAMSAINQALRGETEAIRNFSIDVTDATLKQFALAKGLEKSVSEMTHQEKTLLRMEVIFAQSADKAGDFARTQEDLANATRTLGPMLTDIASSMGQQLLPAATKVVAMIKDLLKWFTSLPDSMKTAVIVVGAITAGFAGLLLVLPFVISGFAALGVVGGVLSGMLGLTTISATGTTVAFGALNLSMLPIIGIIAAISLAIVGGILIWKNWATIVEFFKKVWGTTWTFLKSTAITALNFIIGAINAYTLVQRKAMALILKAVQAVAGVFSDDLADGIQVAIDALNRGIPKISTTTQEVKKMGDAASVTTGQVIAEGSASNEAATSTAALAASATVATPAVSGLGAAAAGAAAKTIDFDTALKAANQVLDRSNTRWEIYRDLLDQARDRTEAVAKAIKDKLTAAIADQVRKLESVRDSWDTWTASLAFNNQTFSELGITFDDVMVAIGTANGKTRLEVRDFLRSSEVGVGDLVGAFEAFKASIGGANVTLETFLALVAQGLAPGMGSGGSRGGGSGSGGGGGGVVIGSPADLRAKRQRAVNLANKDFQSFENWFNGQGASRSDPARGHFGRIFPSAKTWQDVFDAFMANIRSAQAMPVADQGGIVQGQRGRHVPILALPGERLLTETQQRRGGMGTTIVFNQTIQGDVNGVDDLRETTMRWVRDAIGAGRFHGLKFGA